MNYSRNSHHRYAQIMDIAGYLPDRVLHNNELAALYPEWPAEKIHAKTGILERRIAAPDQTASDLAYAAAQALFARAVIQAEDVDFIILCTQAPDYILPTSACVLQERLGISRSAGALDINLGCSGFVYGLSLAKGLIETGAANCVLLLTADTYSKFIHPQDKSVRTLFGDGAAATVVVGVETEHATIGPFVFGTDGRGAPHLMVQAGAFRKPSDTLSAIASADESGNIRSADNLYMNGAEVMAFSLREVPRAANALLEKSGMGRDDIDYFVLHQANRFMLEALRKKLCIPEHKLPILVERCGNTVSSSIPLALLQMRDQGQLNKSQQLMLIGFGVGYSWAACTATINFEQGYPNE